jgi:hypothetical protein
MLPAFFAPSLIAANFLCPPQPKTQFAVDIAQYWIRFGQYFPQAADNLCRPPLRDCLINLRFKCLGLVGTRAKRARIPDACRRSPWACAIAAFVAWVSTSSGVIFRTSSSFQRVGNAEVRCKSVLREKVDVAWVEPLGLVSKNRSGPIGLSYARRRPVTGIRLLFGKN